MAEELSLEELASWTGEPVECLRQWRDLKLFGGEGSDRFAPEDAEAVRLIQMALKRGIGLETIVELAGGRSLLWTPYRLASSSGAKPVPMEEAAERAGLDRELLARLQDAAAVGESERMMDEGDVAMAKSLKAALDAGFPEEAVIQMARVYADTFARIAEAETRLFGFYVQERLKAVARSDAEWRQATEAASVRLYDLIEPILLYFHRKSLVRAAREDSLVHLAQAAGLLEVGGGAPGQMHAAIVFVDISSFTPLTDAMGDVAAAHVIERFADLVREAVSRRPGRVVKQIGDGFMLAFSEAKSAVACALEIEQRADGQEQFPAVRAGVHWGSVLYREGDYVGSNVNIASRVAAEATRHQVLVTGDARRATGELPDVEFLPLGSRRLRGLSNEIELYEARPGGMEVRSKQIDPVCGMELRPAEVAARIAQDGEERVFCSQDCLRRYLSLPGGYPAALSAAAPER